MKASPHAPEHVRGGYAVILGAVYRGVKIPDLNGTVFLRGLFRQLDRRLPLRGGNC